MLTANLFHPVALGLDKEIGNFEVGKEFDALLINPKASDSPIDLFSGDLVGDTSEVSKINFIKSIFFMKYSQYLPWRKKKEMQTF